MQKPEEGKTEPKATEKVSVGGLSDLVISEETQELLKSAGDVSDADLKAARLSGVEKVDEAIEEKAEIKAEVAEPKDEKAEPVVESESDLDAIFKEILAEKEETKRKSLADKTDRPEENKIRELERKVEKLAAMNQAKNEPQNLEVPKYSEEVYQAIADRVGADVDDVKKVTSLLDMAFITKLKPQLDSVLEELNALKAKTGASEVQGQLVKDKLYDIVKDDYEDILKNDELVNSLPEAHRHKVALAMAKERNMDKILVAVKKKASTGRRVIPSTDTSSSVTSSPAKKSVSREFSREDLTLAKMLGLTAEDLKKAATDQYYTEG